MAGRANPINVTTVLGALQSSGVGAIRQLFQYEANPSKIVSAIRRGFPGLDRTQRQELYQHLAEPYKAAKLAAAQPPVSFLNLHDIPVRNPPKYTVGVGATSGIHANITIAYTLGDDPTVRHAQVVIVGGRQNTIKEFYHFAGTQYLRTISESHHTFTAGRLGQPNIVGYDIRSLHRVTKEPS